MSITVKHYLLVAISLIGIVAVFFAPRIGQDPAYHQFVDGNSYLGIPNTLNLLSNLVFAWVGLEGLYRLTRQKSLQILDQIFPAYLIFFIGLILVAFGSSYYHWSPNNGTLVWDRLPMTIAFMSFFTILCAERISISLAKKLFPLLLIAGVASIVYWHYSEQAGNGDLRPYALVQFLPILLAPLILLLLKSRYTRSSDIYWFLAWYLIAKLLEWMDAEIFDWLVVISGHSLKHVAAAIGCWVYLRHLHLRAIADA